MKDDESSSYGLFRHVCGWETILISAGVRYDSRRTRSPLAPAIADEGVVLTVRFTQAGRKLAFPPFCGEWGLILCAPLYSLSDQVVT